MQYNSPYAALQRSLSELETLRVPLEGGEKIKAVNERATLFRITSNAMINVSTELTFCYHYFVFCFCSFLFKINLNSTVQRFGARNNIKLIKNGKKSVFNHRDSVFPSPYCHGQYVGFIYQNGQIKT